MVDMFLENLDRFCNHHSYKYTYRTKALLRRITAKKSGSIISRQEQLQIVGSLNFFQLSFEMGMLTIEEVRLREERVCEELLKPEINFEFMRELLHADKTNDNLNHELEFISETEMPLVDVVGHCEPVINEFWLRLGGKVYYGACFELQREWSDALDYLYLDNKLHLSIKELSILPATEKNNIAVLMLAKLKAFLLYGNGRCNVQAYICDCLEANKTSDDVSLVHIKQELVPDYHEYLSIDQFTFYCDFIASAGRKDCLLVLPWNKLLENNRLLEINSESHSSVVPVHMMIAEKRSLKRSSLFNLDSKRQKALSHKLSPAIIVSSALLTNIKKIAAKVTAENLHIAHSLERTKEQLEALAEVNWQVDKAFWQAYNNSKKLRKNSLLGRVFFKQSNNLIDAYQVEFIQKYYFSCMQLQLNVIKFLSERLANNARYVAVNIAELKILQEKLHDYAVLLFDRYKRVENLSGVKNKEIGDSFSAFHGSYFTVVNRLKQRDKIISMFVAKNDDALQSENIIYNRENYKTNLLLRLADGFVLSDHDLALLVVNVTDICAEQQDDYSKYYKQMFVSVQKTLQNIELTNSVAKVDYDYLLQIIKYLRAKRNLRELIELRRLLKQLCDKSNIRELATIYGAIGYLNDDLGALINKRLQILSDEYEIAESLFISHIDHENASLKRCFGEIKTEMINKNIVNYSQLVSNTYCKTVEIYYKKKRGIGSLKQIMSQLEDSVRTRINRDNYAAVVNEFNIANRENRLITNEDIADIENKYPLHKQGSVTTEFVCRM